MKRKNPRAKVPAGAMLVVEVFDPYASVHGIPAKKLTARTKRADVGALAIVLAHGRQILGAMWCGPVEAYEVTWLNGFFEFDHAVKVGHVTAVKGYGPLLYDCTALVVDMLGFDCLIRDEEQSGDAERLWARNAPDGIWSPRYGDDFKKTYGAAFETLLERGQALPAKERRNYINAGENFRAFGDPNMVWTLSSRFGGRLH